MEHAYVSRVFTGLPLQNGRRKNSIDLEVTKELVRCTTDTSRHVGYAEKSMTRSPLSPQASK